MYVFSRKKSGLDLAGFFGGFLGSRSLSQSIPDSQSTGRDWRKRNQCKGCLNQEKVSLLALDVHKGFPEEAEES